MYIFTCGSEHPRIADILRELAACHRDVVVVDLRKQGPWGEKDWMKDIRLAKSLKRQGLTYFSFSAKLGVRADAQVLANRLCDLVARRKTMHLCLLGEAARPSQWDTCWTVAIALKQHDPSVQIYHLPIKRHR